MLIDAPKYTPRKNEDKKQSASSSGNTKTRQLDHEDMTAELMKYYGNLPR